MNSLQVFAALGALLVVGAATASCSSRKEGPRVTPNVADSGTAKTEVANPAEPPRPLAKGDKVISAPVAVMEIAGIGPRSSFVEPDSDNVAFDVAGTLRDGSSPLKTVPVDAEIVYGLRFVGEQRVFEMVSVARAHEVGLRRVVDKKTAEAILVRLRALDTPPPALPSPPETMMQALKLGNDLWGHLALTRLLLLHERDSAFSPDHKRQLSRALGFVSAEIATATERKPDDVESEICRSVGSAKK
ncbi:MAG: hypothetical protein HOO96_07060 [Polyangiaceae bacterium]|nr:hypothetical protein [Polyangiaceae bacterium]